MKWKLAVLVKLTGQPVPGIHLLLNPHHLSTGIRDVHTACAFLYMGAKDQKLGLYA